MKKKKNRSDQQTEKAKEIIRQFVSTFSQLEISKDFGTVVDIVIEQRKRGKIITTGMGKAGIAMRKFASTLCSFGFPAVYMHPGEASHGDLGLINKQDILFVASTSGKTREIVEIISLARNLDVKKVIGITSHPNSPLRDMVDYIIDMGIILKNKNHIVESANQKLGKKTIIQKAGELSIRQSNTI